MSVLDEAAAKEMLERLKPKVDTIVGALGDLPLHEQAAVLGAAIGGMCRAVDEKSPLPGLGDLFRDAVHKIAGSFK